MVARILRDPLAHFLFAGLVLSAIYNALHPGWTRGDDAYRIAVTRDGLLTFIQYRSKIFEPSIAEARMNAMTSQELRQLVDDYVKEEALYREALALGLEKQDYIIKRRMVQKVEFIASGVNEDAIEIGEPELERYYRANMARFSNPPDYSFTHVFIAEGSRSRDSLMAAAERAKANLTTKGATFGDAPRFGDRFPYGVNFVEVSQQQVESQFGQAFASKLAQLKAKEGVWQGPILSSFGAHVIMLQKSTAPSSQGLDDVRPEVEAEYRRVLSERQADKAVANMVSRYVIDIDFEDARLPSAR